jgi:uncharacterized protein (DUF983 family)
MKSNCSHCGLAFEPEPGFYYGAMFVSYALSVLLLLVVGLLLNILIDPSEWVYIGVVSACVLLFAPLNFRLSRSIFLHAFGYKKTP